VTKLRSLLLILSILLLGGCAEPIATAKRAHPNPPAAGPDSQSIAIHRDLDQAEKIDHQDPMRALGLYLSCGRRANLQLERRPNDVYARGAYNFAVARCVDVIQSAPLDPWSKPLRVPSADGEFVLTTVRHPNTDRDPAAYNITPADELVVGGSYLEKRTTVDGIGAPVVAVGREEKPDFRKTLTARRLYAGATAVIHFDSRHARLEFVDPLSIERISLDGHSAPIAADFTAPLAVGLTQERPEKLGLARLLRPEKYADTARLTRLQPYDSNRIPVIFVHGLQDTPACWVTMVNTLWADAEIRRRYQFWVYSYPSGYPYPYSAALFRDELDAVKRSFPNEKNIILVGHSMGGMISRLMITDAGDKIWHDFFGKPPAETNIPGPSKQHLVDALIFSHRPEVRRVIFMSSPHRGAAMASNWIGRIGASLIKTPFLIAAVPFHALKAATVQGDPGTDELNRIPNSIDTLSPNNRFVREINTIPIRRGVPYHSIIGDRGRGDTPNSSDGVVAYSSAHLDGAQSELIVPSNHSSPRNAKAIAEVSRILKLNR
jgi:pimeloyl-ACP methyl ester carboxylesterase